MSRRLINDRKLATKISQQFVPFAGSIERLQPSRYGGSETPASRWFQRKARRAFKQFAPKGFWEKFKSYQGFYVLGPEGSAYSYQVVWKLTPAEVVSELDRALKVYGQTPPKRFKLKALTGARPLSAPPGTSILRVFSRVRPVPAGADPSNRGIGRDQMWVLPAEVRQLLKASSPKAFALPEPIVARLVRYQLLDHTRNVSPGFEAREVKKADFQARLKSTHRRYQTIEFWGRYESQGRTGENKPFGVEGELKGELVVDSKSAKITRCRAYGEAVANGQATPGAPHKPYPLVFAIVDSYDQFGLSVPPLGYGLSPLFRGDYMKPKRATGSSW